MFFRVSDEDKKLIDAICVSVNTIHEVSAEDARDYRQALERRPLYRFFVLSAVRRELASAGISAIDWDGIGDFLVKIAPILLEILKMFL